MTSGASFPEYTKNSENILNVIKKKMAGQSQLNSLLQGEVAKDIWGVLVEKLLNGYSLDIESILKIMRREEFGFLVDYKLLVVMWLQRPDQCIHLQKQSFSKASQLVTLWPGKLKDQIFLSKIMNGACENTPGMRPPTPETRKLEKQDSTLQSQVI